MTVQAETIIYADLATPQTAFAVKDLQEALADRGCQAKLLDQSNFDKISARRRVVLALSSDRAAVSLMSSRGGRAFPTLAKQAYALRSTTTGGECHWVFGGDANGLMYGILQLAEYVRMQGLSGPYHEEDSPYLKNRGIKFNIPLDIEAPTYFHGHHGTSHKLAIRHVWDMKFWQTWFDEMARHRFNVLSLWSPHPFTSMVNMEDEYPGTAIQGTRGFNEAGEVEQINTLSIDEKVAFWQAVMKYGRNRGFDLYFSNWNIFLSGAEGKHGLTHDPHNQKTKEYLRKCLIRFLDTYPDVKGFGITVGERMGDLDLRQREEWAWETFGLGMLQYAQAHPDRELVFVHRQHDGNIDHILNYFSPLNDLPNVRLELSCKYSEAHAHTTTTPARWHATGMEKGLGKYGIQSWLTIRNDDFFFLHWAEPQFVREYVRGFPQVDRYVCGFYIGADGWVSTKEFVSLNPYYRDQDALCIQRTWLTQTLWGRISYNPAVPDDFFKRHLALHYPEACSDKLFEAWNAASGAVRKANEQVTGGWRFDMDFWPEMWTGDNWDDGIRGRHFSVEDTKEATPFPGSSLGSLRDTAEGRLGSKISAWENADQIETRAQHALDLLKTLDAGSNVELQLTLKDIRAQANLGLYNAHKFRAVMHSIQGAKDKARDAMGVAYGYWRHYTDLMSALYRPVEMQRNKSFASWHDYDDVVLRDYHALGGTDVPER